MHQTGRKVVSGCVGLDKQQSLRFDISVTPLVASYLVHTLEIWRDAFP